MFTPTRINGNNQYAAAHYFASGDDYYTKENPGVWFGKGAEALGLEGAIDPTQFARMLDGLLPNGERIARTFNAEDNSHRMGYDFTFSPPKSISMQSLIAGDTRLVQAHDRAVARAVAEIEKLAVGRRKINGKSARERTSNMVIGLFRHEMSRAKDPQLHTHAVALNMTQRSDGAWRALAVEDVYRLQHVIGAVYMAELAKDVVALGYDIRVVDDKGNFELGHITREQIELFSQRGMLIEKILAGDGKSRKDTTALEKQIISFATRKGKDERDRPVIRRYWVGRAKEAGIDFGPFSTLSPEEYALPSQALGSTPANHPGTLTKSDSGQGNGQTRADPDSTGKGKERTNVDLMLDALPKNLTPAQAAVEFAIKHLTERESVATEAQLVNAALGRAVGLVGAQDIVDRIKVLVSQGALIEAEPRYRLAIKSPDDQLERTAHGWTFELQRSKGWTSARARQYVSNAINRGTLVQTETRFTTHKALKLERAILALERDGRNRLVSIRTPEEVQTALEGSILNQGQRAAVEGIVCSRNRFVGIQGDAGTGKTTMVKEAVRLLQAEREQQGYRVLALAPYGAQVKALKNEGLDAHTVASFLKTKRKPIDEHTVVVLDEAALVGIKNMAQLMRLVESAGARMVMLGDTKQTEAIEAGKPFHQLQEAGMATTRINEIQRQKDPELKRAVELAADSSTTQSLGHIKHIEAISDAGERYAALVGDFMNQSEAERNASLIVAGTNDARRQINALVRDAIGVAGQGMVADTLLRVDMTQAQRRYAPSYKAGMVIVPERDYERAGLQRGQVYKVVEARAGNQLLLQKTDGTQTTINPRTVTQLSVYALERAELSPGDIVRINRNDAARDLTNGDRFRVAAVSPGLVQLQSISTKPGEPTKQVSLPSLRPLHLEHAYASTTHGAQGLTTDRVFIDLDTKSRTTSMNLYYVAISRARHAADIYTNSIEGLPAAIARRYDKTTAMDIAHERRESLKSLEMRTKSGGDKKLFVQRPGLAIDARHERAAAAAGISGIEK